MTYTTDDYHRDVQTLKGFDLGVAEGGAALGAGAIDESTLMEAYAEMDQLLRRIRTFEIEQGLPKTRWDYDGSTR